MRLDLGIDLAEFYGDIRQFRRTVAATAPWILIPLAVFGWVVADQAMKPVVTLTQAVRGITARGLDQRVCDARADSELQNLIRVVNAMLDRLERSFEQATHFGADAAHELKTPLTILQGELQQAIHNVPPGSAERSASPAGRGGAAP